jgi:hypothetical protein
MSGKMERDYVDEKKQALEGLDGVSDIAFEVSGLLGSWCYDVSNIIDPAEVHDEIHAARSRLDNVRLNFEKVRWSSAETEVSFNDWLHSRGHADLVVG